MPRKRAPASPGKAEARARATTAAREARLDAIRHMLAQGYSEARIVHLFASGQAKAADGTELPQTSAVLVNGDLRTLGEAWRKLHDDPLVIERQVGTVYDRLRRMAARAETAALDCLDAAAVAAAAAAMARTQNDPAGMAVALREQQAQMRSGRQFFAEVRAYCATMMEFLGIRSERWRSRLNAMTAPGDEPMTAEELAAAEAAKRFARMTDAELDVYIQTSQVRVRGGLQVIAGGKADK